MINVRFTLTVTISVLRNNRRVTRACKGGRVHRRYGENCALLSRAFDDVDIDTTRLRG